MDRLDTQLGGAEEVVEDNDSYEDAIKDFDTGSQICHEKQQGIKYLLKTGNVSSIISV